MRETLTHDVVAIGRAMNERGWVLQIEDCFRTLEMQRQLVRKPSVFDTILKKCIWELGGEIPTPELMFRRSIVLTANMPKIGAHMSGSAIDISVWRRDDGTEVWRGYPYLEMSECTPMRSPFVAPEFIENRLAITGLMEKHGFLHFPFEFWHYDKDDAAMHIVTGKPTPCRFGAVNWDRSPTRSRPSKARPRCSIHCPIEQKSPLGVPLMKCLHAPARGVTPSPSSLTAENRFGANHETHPHPPHRPVARAPGLAPCRRTEDWRVQADRHWRRRHAGGRLSAAG
jgi:D-alanyl-D-alanine dipeptidase